MRYPLELNVNGETYSIEVDPYRCLLDVLRDDLGLTGTKRGCEDGRCGSCTVLLNGKLVKACLILALQANGAQILTIEGLAKDDELHPLQESFIEYGAVQCGYCTPGMIMAAKALLDENPCPTEQDVREALKGNLCRCGTYFNATRAILACAMGK